MMYKRLVNAILKDSKPVTKVELDCTALSYCDDVFYEDKPELKEVPRVTLYDSNGVVVYAEEFIYHDAKSRADAIMRAQDYYVRARKKFMSK